MARRTRDEEEERAEEEEARPAPASRHRGPSSSAPSRSSSSSRYARLRADGGARLAAPTEAAREAVASEFAEVRLAMFRALADPTRFVLVELLRRHGPLATTELEVALGVTSGTTSHHLRVLEAARLVVPERVAGGWTFWRLVSYPMIETLVPRLPQR